MQNQVVSQQVRSKDGTDQSKHAAIYTSAVEILQNKNTNPLSSRENQVNRNGSNFTDKDQRMQGESGPDSLQFL